MSEDYDYADIWGAEPEPSPEQVERLKQINVELGIDDANDF